MIIEKMIYDDKQSLLLASGLSLKEIGKVLVESKTDRDIEKKLKEIGGKYLERFLTFKKYKELTFGEKLKEPIIPIIGSLPGIGKTTMAREIATVLGIGNVIGGDNFRAALREFVSQENNPEFFTSVYESWKFFGKKNKENILKGFKAQAKIINQAMERIVADRGIRDGENMVIEYLHFLPSQYNKEVIEHPSIIPIILNLKSEAIWRRRIKLRVKKTHFKGGFQRLLDALDNYRLMQEYQCREAKKFNVPIVITDNWRKSVDEVLDIILNRVKKLNELKSQAKELKIVKKLKKERGEK